MEKQKQLDIADGRITRLDLVNGVSFHEDAYDLGTTSNNAFFAAVSKGTEHHPKGQLVLVPTHAIAAIYMEVESVEQQDTDQNKD